MQWGTNLPRPGSRNEQVEEEHDEQVEEEQFEREQNECDALDAVGDYE